MGLQENFSEKSATELLYAIEAVLRNRNVTQAVRVRFPLVNADRCWEWRCEDDGDGNPICHMVEVPC